MKILHLLIYYNEITLYFHLSRSFDRKQQLQAPAPGFKKISLKIAWQLYICTVYRNLLLNKNIILICNTISCQQYCRSIDIQYTIQLLNKVLFRRDCTLTGANRENPRRQRQRH